MMINTVAHRVAHVYGMRWLPLVGSFKKKISIAKDPCQRDLYSDTYIVKEPINHRHSIPELDSITHMVAHIFRHATSQGQNAVIH